MRTNKEINLVLKAKAYLQSDVAKGEVLNLLKELKLIRDPIVNTQAKELEKALKKKYKI
ncbi:TPA: hypothetical protein R1765_001940 [Campylobacter coli]|nr:hypothetical protein [Campylobacter coli]